MKESFFVLLDKLIRKYLGLNQLELIPQLVLKRGKKLFILNSASCKRHIEKIPVSEAGIQLMNNINRKKLGVAIGKAIASNLVVSFDQVLIKRDNAHAQQRNKPPR